MKKLIAFVCMILSVFVIAACSSPKEFKSEEGRFSVKTPVELTEQTKSIDTPVGAIQLHLLIGETANSGYTVGYVDYPEEIVRQSDTEKMLDGACDGGARNMNGTILSNKSISLDGHSGRELLIDGKAPNGKAISVKSRIYLVKNRLYQLMVAMPRGGADKSEVNNFLDSFKLVGA